MTLPTTKRLNEPIAVIGHGLRFPGGVNNSTQFWDLLQHPRDVRTSIPVDRFSTSGFYKPSYDDHGTSHTHHGYFLGSDHQKFDAEFFGIKPIEAKSMDPQQRLLLEVVYESIEAAGLDMEALRGSLTAVYVGLMAVDYNDMLNRDTSDYPPYVAAGNARSIISNRVSHFFDWRGPSMTIDTACSSSLVAVHLAIQSLRSGDSTLAIAAGANLILGPETFIIGSDMKMLSPDGRSYWCDARANGYARGEGVAAIVLKHLSAAIADGDDIECVIAETGLNQDGRTQGLTVPSADAQAALIQSTYRKAGLDLTQASDRPQYFEAHGTGTPTGDPVEVKAIHDAFFGRVETSGISDQLYCGSVKTLVGHTEGTAGLAGLIKTSLALRYGSIPPSFLFEGFAPSVKPFFDKLRIATEPKSWPTVMPGAVRRASVNSFGFGGTNAHCILESYYPEAPGQITKSASHLPYVFSAPSEKALLDMLRTYSAYFATKPEIDLRALSHTLCGRRTTFPARIAFTAHDLEELRAKVDSTIQQVTKPGLSASVSASGPQILGIFTGQGAQWAGMGSCLMRYPGAVAIIDKLERSLAELSDPPSWSLAAELSKEKSHSRIIETAIAQPACTAVQILLVDMLRAAGVCFSTVVGHSSGEVAAAYAAGYLSARDAIRVAYYRGRHVHLIGGKQGERGSMIAIGASYEEAQNLCYRDEFRGRICIAASSSAASVTLSGDASAVEEVHAMFQASNRFARKLRVDNAYHSHHMVRCSDAITASYRACKIESQRPAVPNCLWVSSVYHQDIALVTDSLDDQYWHSNTVGEVIFSQALEHALQKASFDLAVEIGAHPALKGPALQVIGDTIGCSIPYTGTLNRGIEDDKAFANTLGYMWANLSKSDIDLAAFDRFMTADDPPVLLKGLPTYPWNHERAYWHESRVSRAYRSRPTRHELLGHRRTDYSDDQISWKNHLIPERMTWLQDHRIQGQMIYPGAAYIVSAFEAARQIPGEQPVTSIELTDFVFDQPLVFLGDDSRMEVLTSLHGIRRDNSKITADFTYHSITREASGPMTLNAHCQLHIYYGAPAAAIYQPSAEPLFGMRKVDSNRIYRHLAQYGYQYTGPFQSLTSVSRRLGVASGLIALPQISKTEVLIHPATVDAAMHSIMVAESYPGDGRLTTSRVPTGISKISLNLPTAMGMSSQEHLRFLSRNVDDGARAHGEVKLSLVDSAETILQLEDLRTKPMKLATPSDDICMFSETVWDPRCLLPSSDHKNFESSSQAVNDRVRFLRDPLSADSYHMHSLAEQVVLVGGGMIPTTTCADKVADILQPSTRQLIRAHSIPSLIEIKSMVGNSVVILQDHDKPLFDNFDDGILAGLKHLFATSRNVLWVTQGYKRNKPHARMFVAFARCLVQEMSDIRLQILDFESQDALDAQIIATDFLRLLATARWEEQGSLDGLRWCIEPEIAYEKGTAFVPRVKPCKALNDRYNSASRAIFRNVVADDGAMTQVRVQPVDQEHLFQCGKTYWLAGLTGDLGLSLCEWMINEGARHIALSSRHPKVNPAWLAHFHSLGAIVEICTCDVTDHDSVEATLKSIEARMPRIAGVCHGAMVLQDALFQDVSMAQVERVLKPKVEGAINLDKVFRTRSLDFFVLLSSITAITGNAGQPIYAAANGYLAGLSAQRRARGESASTINLGPIVGAGAMHALTPAQQTKLEKEGVMWTSEHDFHTAFAEAIVASPSDSGSSGEFTTGVRICDASEQYKPKYASNPIFSHMLSHREGLAQPSAIRLPAEPVRAQLLRAGNEDAVFEILEDFLTSKLLRALHMPQDSTVVDKTAEALGIDSLIAVEMRSWLLKELGVDLPLLIIIGGDTMRQVLEVCRARVDPAMTPLLHASEGETVGTEVRSEERDTKLQPSSAGQEPVTTSHAQLDASAGVAGIGSADNNNHSITETTQNTPPAPPLEHVSKEEPVPAQTKPDTGSVPLSNMIPSEQASSQARSPNRHNLLHETNSSTSSSDNNGYGGSAQVIDVKRGSVGVRTVSGGSRGDSTQSQENTKRKGLLGRLLRSRGFVRLRRYV